MPTATADLLVQRLLASGVGIIFGRPGDGINGIFESLRKTADRLRFIQVRHEEAAAFAACRYAEHTGRLAVCIATVRPGPAVVQAVVQAVVDPNEPPLPGKITTEQALHFAEAPVKGQPDRWKIIKRVLADRVGEII